MSAEKSPRALPVSGTAALAGGGGPPYDEKMDERVTKLESDVAAIRTDVALIRSNYATKLDVNDLRNDMHTEFGKGRGETQGVRSELILEIGKLRDEMHIEIGKLRDEMHIEIGKLRDEMHIEFGKIRIEMRDIATDALKWMIGLVVVMVVGMYGMLVSFENTMRALVETRLPVPAAAVAPAPAAPKAPVPPADAAHK